LFPTSSHLAATAKKPRNLPSSLPSNFSGTVRNAVICVVHRIIFAELKFKLIAYFLFVIIGSILKDGDLVPHTYFASKHNIFNQYFVKLGWAWSTILLVPFIYLTSSIYTCGQYKLIARQFIRLMVATGIWFVVTTLFVWIEEITGTCEFMDETSRNMCRKSGYEWQEGHDISGHTFILLYIILIINEEANVYDKVSKKVKLDGADNSSTTVDHREIKIDSAAIKEEKARLLECVLHLYSTRTPLYSICTPLILRYTPPVLHSYFPVLH
jgi:hypothetical protein